MPTQMVDLDQPRRKAVAAMRASLGEREWRRNAAFVESLRQLIAQHPVARHPAINVLNSGALDHVAMQGIHLEYRHAIVQIFTDALLAAQLQSRQLEPRLHPGAKLAPRFLLTLNDLDEFGFRPGLDVESYYRGNPAYAHYPLFERVLDDYGIGPQVRESYVPSQSSQNVREYLDQSYGNYLDVVVLLAAAEEEVILFSPPLREATRALGIDVNDGYYFVHGVSGDETADAADDDHEDDLWLILTQALTPDQYMRVQTLCLRYCDLWAEFWTVQLAQARAETAVPRTAVFAKAR